MCWQRCSACGWQQLGSCVPPAAHVKCCGLAALQLPGWWQSGEAVARGENCFALLPVAAAQNPVVVSPASLNSAYIDLQFGKVSVPHTGLLPLACPHPSCVTCRSLMQRVVSAVMWEGVTLCVVGLVLGICYGKRQCPCVAQPYVYPFWGPQLARGDPCVSL